MDAAYAYMNRYGMDAVKTGYVGKIIPKSEWHDGRSTRAPFPLSPLP